VSSAQGKASPGGAASDHRPPKQEQERASDEVIEVAPGVLRMQLPIRMPGLGHVNMYCLLDDRGAAVIDPGLPGEDSWSVVIERLRAADLQVRHVHTVVVTHSHPDHFGGAARFRAETDCRVIAHECFSRASHHDHESHLEVSVEHLQPGPASTPTGPEPAPELPSGERAPWLRDPQDRPPTPWGGRPPVPTPQQRERWEKMRAAGTTHLFVPRLTHVVRHGSRMRLCGREFRVLHTPGHTADHLCLHDLEEGIFLAGDHVLPSITPHISGLGGTEDPLQDFFDSLDRVADIDGVGRCLPAHGHPFEDLAARTRAIRRHHEDRLETLRGLGSRLGAATVEQLSRELFHPRSWGTMAESETYAHMEHLRLRRLAESRDRGDGVLVYEV
jgi:glyoxylase-like metal-dependent hydrolase (beta-lactamase superfamily II)